MRFDEARDHYFASGVNHFGIARDWQVFADSFDFAAADNDHPIIDSGAAHADNPPAFDVKSLLGRNWSCCNHEGDNIFRVTHDLLILKTQHAVAHGPADCGGEFKRVAAQSDEISVAADGDISNAA